MWGQYRADAVQVHPGTALFGDAGAAARLVLWRFRGASCAGAGGEAALVAGLRALYERKPGIVQLRIFRVAPDESGDYLAMAESSTPPAPVDAAALALLGPAAKHVDLVNTYVAYARQAPGAFPKSR